VRIHSRYNPEAITQYNIVPGLLGVIRTEVWPEAWPIAAFMLAVIAVRLRFFKSTLD
jgi:hypothetical protein